jgi:hypothetical protein
MPTTWVEGVSLGYLYIAAFLQRDAPVGAADIWHGGGLHIFLHDLFGPPIHHLQGRILYNAAALVGFTFVAVILRWFVAQRTL